jgi:hypothetical protein
MSPTKIPPNARARVVIFAAGIINPDFVARKRGDREETPRIPRF